MNVVAYRMTLFEPLLATRLEGEPNSSVSFPFVPGSQVRGAVVAAFLQSRQLSTLDAGQEDPQRLFFDGRTRYLNVYPLTEQRVRCLPTPLSWFAAKGQSSPVFDFALEARSEIDGTPTQFYPLAGDKRPFCHLDGDEVSFLQPDRQVNVHTSRDRRKGRASDKSGAVFQYDALAAGMQLCGFVLTEKEADAKMIASLLQQVTTLGRSGNSGYGRVEIEVDPGPISGQSWREVGGIVGGISAGTPFLVTLLSDAIVRDPQTGQHTADLVPALQEMLAVELHHVPLNSPEQRGARRVQEVGAFNRTWGLPITQAQALAGGSVFVLVSSRAISSDRLQDLEWRGVGERRAEGFGRLVFQWQSEPELETVEPPKQLSSEKAPEVHGTAESLARRMVARLLRRDLDAALQMRINALEMDPRPHTSQIGRFRVIAREALATGNAERLVHYLQDVDKRRLVREQFQRARVAGMRLDRWLDERLQDPGSVWRQLGTTGAVRRLGQNVSCSVDDDPALALEYTIRLIDGVLAKAARKNREKEDAER